MTDTTSVPAAPSPFAAPPAGEDGKKAEAKVPPFWWPEPRTFIVGWMMISSFAIVVLCWWKPPSADNQILNTLIGVYVATGFTTAIGWWMGSSKGSDDKSQAINDQLVKGQ